MSVKDSLKELLALTSDKIASTFHEKPYDPSKDRKALQKRLQKAHDQYTSATPAKGRKLFTVNHKGEIELKLPFEVGGKDTFYFDEGGKFTQFLAHMSQLVGLGEFDEHLKDQRPPATSTAPKTPGAGWSPERRAKFDAKIAARKAAK